VTFNGAGCVSLSAADRAILASTISAEIALAIALPSTRVFVTIELADGKCRVIIDFKGQTYTDANSAFTNFLGQLNNSASALRTSATAKDLDLAGLQVKTITLITCPDNTLQDTLARCPQSSASKDPTPLLILGVGLVVMLLLFMIGCWWARRAELKDAQLAAEKRIRAEMELQNASITAPGQISVTTR
jgi:hypothetical protein